MMSKFKGEIPKATMPLDEALTMPVAKGIPERKITERTCKHFDVRAEFHESEGTVVAYLFPVTKNNKITGFKRLIKDGRCSKKQRFSTVGDVTDDSDYVGAKQASRGKKLFITEGEYDMLTLFQVLSSKYNDQYTPAVVSLVSGVNTAASGAAANNAMISNFEELITVYDSDEQGQDAVRETALIQPHLQNVLLDLKDSGEYLMDDRVEELIDKVFKPTEFNIEQIKFGAVDIDDLMRPTAKGIMLDVLPQLMDKLKGLRPAEFTVILAPPKSGKTTLCKAINYALLRAEKPTMGIYLEEDLIKTQQSFIALDHNIHLPTYRARPDQLTQAQVQGTMDTILNPAHAFFCDDKTGHLTPDKLMAVLMWAAIKGCKFVILDHISFVFSGLKSADERKEIDKLLTDIAAFVKQSGVHVIAVAHVVMDRNRGKERDKDGIIYPHWYNTEDTDGRGSGAFAQLCHNMIGIDKEITELGLRGHTRVRVLFNREWDYTGVCDELTLNQHTGWLESV